MKKKRARNHPYHALAMACGAAAANIENPKMREITAKAASQIPVLDAEQGAGRRAEMARSARSALASLVKLQPDELVAAQAKLRTCANNLLYSDSFKCLGQACLSAAAKLRDPEARLAAADIAARIPVFMSERGNGRRAEIARLARLALTSLPTAQPDEFAEMKARLVGFGDALLSRFEETSFTQLGQRRRRRDEGEVRAN